MLINTKGIVFKSTKYSETSLICTIYTDELGLRQYMVNGVRSAKAKTKANLFRPMNILDLVVYERQNKAINRIKEVQFGYIYQAIPFDLIKGSIGLFMAEVAQKTVKENVANLYLFEFLANSFIYLDKSEEKLANFPIYFMIKLSSYLGFTPSQQIMPDDAYFDLQEGVFTSETPEHAYFLRPEASKILQAFLNKTYTEISALKLAKKDRQNFLNHLIDYYRLHVEGMVGLNSPGVLQEVLE